MVTHRAPVVWRYLPRRSVKHALRASAGYAGHESTALCGTAPAWFAPQAEQWWGTGTQTEHETVEKLPECRRCAVLLAAPRVSAEERSDDTSDLGGSE